MCRETLGSFFEEWWKQRVRKVESKHKCATLSFEDIIEKKLYKGKTVAVTGR